jgi:protein required for attachment to host cells
MSKHWIVIANRIRVKVIEENGGKLKIVTEFENPAGHAKDADIQADRYGKQTFPGRAVFHQNANHSSPSEGHRVALRDEILTRFMRAVSEFLDKEVPSQRVDEIALVADPRSLGILKKCLHKGVASKVDQMIAKNFADLSHPELIEHLKDVECLKHAELYAPPRYY